MAENAAYANAVAAQQAAKKGISQAELLQKQQRRH